MLLYQYSWFFSLYHFVHLKLLVLSQTNNKYNIKNLINIRKTKDGRVNEGNPYKNQVKRSFLVIYNK
jgi:hypothetical protein